MIDDNISRRKFLTGLATTGAAATFVDAQTPNKSTNPVVATNHPVVESKPGEEVIKIVCAEKLTPAEIEQVRSAGKNIALRMLSDRSELKNNVADAEVILGVVDRETMLAAKKLKWVQTWAAGVENLPDVVTPEPLPPESPLWDCPNLVITPHNSGNAPIRQVRLMALVAENVRRYSNGLPLLNVMDKARGY